MRLWFLATLLLCTSVFSEEDALTPDAYFGAIAALNLNSELYGDSLTYHQTINRFLFAKLQRIHSPCDLRTIFHQCVKVWHATRLESQPQEQMQWLDPYYETLVCIVYRLSRIGSDEAAKVLVELYRDDSVGWDAGFSLCGADAIVKCGKAALPHLEKKKDLHRLERLIFLIRSGASTAF